MALLLLTPALVLVLTAVTVSLLVLSGLPADTGGSAEAGLARVGNDLALIIVTDVNGSVADTRETIANWGLLAPAVGLVLASFGAWWFSGRVEATVETARSEVDSADAERRSRLQEVVHELRTPLAVMGTNLELASLDPVSAESTYIDAARRAVERMARTVDDLEGHGRLAVEQEERPVDLGSLVESVGAEHVGPGRAKGVSVLVRGTGVIFVPSVDSGAVRAAVGNFLSNAVRLAPGGSAVIIDWGTHDQWAWVSVTDQGPGLPEHLHSRVFERGWQGSHDRDRSAGNGGSGLGLTIARQLTEAQGGLVTLDSEEGGGATFAVWLPLGHGADDLSVVAPDGIHPVARPWQKEALLVAAPGTATSASGHA
ncbi:MAG: HAMP domain-containing sensor histidine kinase [Acidimicrobiia bacterium]|jgi:signal transduction histidine kinase